MSEQITVCPWCQSEIIWDPEIGPESECPYCYNELGEYRSVTLQLDEDLQDEQPGEQSFEYTMMAEQPNEDELGDDYARHAEALIDRQEETPECTSCHQFMLLSGRQTVVEANYTPVVPGGWSRPFLAPPFSVKLYVCPSCFKVESYLSEQDRQALVKTIRSANDE